jgi:streptogramin lyase
VVARLVVSMLCALAVFVQPALPSPPGNGRLVVHRYQRYSGEEGFAVGFGSLWVGAAQNGEAVARVAIGTGRARSITAPTDQDTALAAGPTAVWVSDFGDGAVMRIDVKRDRVTQTTKGLAGAAEIAVAGGNVWVGLHHGQSVAELDGATGRELERIPLPPAADGVTANGPTGIALAFGSVWVAVPNLNEIVRLDPRTRRPVATIHAGSDCCGPLAAAGGGVWAASDSGLERIDPRTNRVDARVRLQGPSLAVLDGRLWAAVSNKVVSVDPRTGKLGDATHVAHAFFTGLVSGAGALWAWDANAVQVVELRPS